MTTVIFVPGWGDSPPGHWQRDWFDEATAAGQGPVWVTQRDWEGPDPGAWVEALAERVAAAPAGAPLALVAHSLGVLVVLRWAARRPEVAASRVAGALLVAAPDPAGPAFPDVLPWGEAESAALPFPATLVSSDDDPYAAPDWSAARAGEWGARHVVLPAAGHLNAAAGFGPWPRSRELLADVLRRP
ncbi:MAG: alpha/beta hydrolase [Kineosporiaceae bacterium]